MPIRSRHTRHTTKAYAVAITVAGAVLAAIAAVIGAASGDAVTQQPSVISAATGDVLTPKPSVISAAPGDAVTQHPPAATGLRYVAMGSSFAAGPGVPPLQSGAGAAACSRSVNNYPSYVARAIDADFTDVTCSGATTANILTDTQNGQPPQIEAVNAQTQAVTVTIGGNDINYLGSLNTYSCQTSGEVNCGSVDRAAIDRALISLPGRLSNVVNAVHAKAPQAKVFFVTYFTVLPASGRCEGTPLTANQAIYERSISSRLLTATRQAADSTDAVVVDVAGASAAHHVCAPQPWVEDYAPPSGRSTYHPNEAGMHGASKAVEAAFTTAGL
ncbi:SGNH/GDSL hydrolase family protein [Streptomyces sp. NPDC056663]|uniref:SGNH/GDSL hydrolase family protein n=1 Tax=Streptomyces sp. NPDC056663 TaxID=3345899 RepID=UPI00368B75FC